jgi:predicted helicase
VTNRDAWCINPSLRALKGNVEATIRFYNEERARWEKARESGTGPQKIADFLNPDPKRISWTRQLRKDAEALKPLDQMEGQFVPCMYRPFTKRWQFYSRRLNEMIYKMPRIFPNGELPNRVIAVTGKGGRAGFSALMLDTLPSLDTVEKGQCFPFWLYEEPEQDQGDIFEPEETDSGLVRRDAITKDALAHFRQAYPGEAVSREDVFHYIYGLLHSEDYRERFRNNLAKGVPRIPCVKSVAGFRAFRDAGQRLGGLHVGYESVTPFPATIDSGDRDLASVADPVSFYRVAQMRHLGSGKTKDLSSVIYNDNLTIRDIPESAWSYVINGKPALAWVMERQAVRTDKPSGIVSDANEYAVESMQDPRYPLDLFARVITVSLETMQIVDSLPALEID